MCLTNLTHDTASQNSDPLSILSASSALFQCFFSSLPCEHALDSEGAACDPRILSHLWVLADLQSIHTEMCYPGSGHLVDANFTLVAGHCQAAAPMLGCTAGSCMDAHIQLYEPISSGGNGKVLPFIC